MLKWIVYLLVGFLGINASGPITYAVITNKHYEVHPRISFDLDAIALTEDYNLALDTPRVDIINAKNTNIINNSLIDKVYYQSNNMILVPKGLVALPIHDTNEAHRDLISAGNNLKKADLQYNLFVAPFNELNSASLVGTNIDSIVFETEDDILYDDEYELEEYLALREVLSSDEASTVLLPEETSYDEQIQDEDIEYITDHFSGLKGEEIIVSLNINYENQDQLYTIIRTSNNNFLLPLEAIEPIKINNDYLRVGFVSFNDKQYINITQLNETIIKFDRTNLTVDIVFPIDKMNIQFFDSAIHANVKNHGGREAKGAFLNYDLTFSRTAKTKYFSSIQDLNYFFDKGVLYNSFFIKGTMSNIEILKEKDQKKLNSYWIRLETNWTFDSTHDLARWRVGDVITRSADWSGSSRILGIQYATNFAVKPGLITHPLVDFVGRTELPSVVDVYTKSGSLYHGESKAGNFNIANLPVTTGRGELVVETKDITGKVKTLIFPYYLAPSLLAKGLSDFSLETGIQRQKFGINSNKYRYFVTNGDYKRGITDYWTSSIHFESLQDQASTGISNMIQVGDIGVASVSVATNIQKLKDSQKLSLGYYSQIGNINYNLSTSVNGKKYQDIYNYPARVSQSSSVVGSIGYSNKKFGGIFISLISNTFYGLENDKTRARTLSLTYDKNITQASFFRFMVGTDLSSPKKNSFAHLSFATDLNGKSIYASNSIQRGKSVKQIAIASQYDYTSGLSYRANFTKSDVKEYDIQLNKSSQYFNTALYLYNDDNSKNQQLGFTGSVAYINRGLYFTKSIYDSLAVVKVGNLKGIKVYSNNRKVGFTNSRGEILIPDLPSYVVSEIKLDEEKLPLDVDFESTLLKVLPKWKSGTIVDFKVKKVKGVEIILIDPTGKILPFDQEVNVEGMPEELFIGYDGKLYLNDINNIKVIRGKSCNENQCCTFSADIDDKMNEPIIDLGTLICK
ncbi:MAG: fimbrial biogenesis outer membrane usher protein [Rickettsiaceae bacterium]|nr:MAG: fimbrial biogenesis outer membrane usher protein [Rickettsiaceae bacterium]